LRGKDSISFPFTFGSHTFDDSGFHTHDSVRIHLHYRPSVSKDSAVFVLHYSLDDIPYDTTLTLLFVRNTAASITVRDTPVTMVSRQACLEAQGSFIITSGPCDSLMIVGVQPEDSAHFSVTGVTFPLLAAAGSSVSIPIVAYGVRKDTLTTPLDITLVSDGIKTHVSVLAKLIVLKDGVPKPGLAGATFVTPTNICTRRLATVPIKNLGCNPLVCDTVRWLASVPDLKVVRMPSFPDTLDISQRDSIVLEFTPENVGNETAILEWKMHSASQHIDTITGIHTSAYSLSRATLSDSALEFGSLLICDTNERISFIHDDSCLSPQIVSFEAPQNSEFELLAPPLHTWIAPGDSTEVLIGLRPNSGGERTDSVTFILQDSAGAEQSLTVQLHGIIVADTPHIQIAPTSITSADLSPCSSLDTSISIRNASRCQSIALSASLRALGTWFSLDSTGEIELAPGDSETLRIHVRTTSDSASTNAVHIVGTSIDTFVALAASNNIGGTELAVRAPDTVFHAKLCSSDAKHFVWKNGTCGPVELEGLALTDSNTFAMLGAWRDTVVAPGDSVTMQILYSAEDTLDHSSSLVYRTADGRVSGSIPLSAIT